MKARKKLKENEVITIHHSELQPGIVLPNVVTTVKNKRVLINI